MNLTEFLTNHPVNDILTPEEIIVWLDKHPILQTTADEETEFEWADLALTWESQARLFAIRDVPKWYSELAHKISLNEDIIVLSAGTTDWARRGKIRFYGGKFISAVTEMGETNLSMQELIVQLLTRFPSSFFILLNLLVASGVITEIEMFRLAQVELNPAQKRWESLGLSSAPGLGDLP
jgi:hypothetical protein